MPFAKKCTGAPKHKDWDVSDGLELRSISDKYKNALLDLLGKTSKRDRTRSCRFCTGCVEHLTEVRPELFKEESTGDHSYDANTSATEDAPAKKRRLEHHQKEASTQTETDTVGLLVAALSEGFDIKDLPQNVINSLSYDLGRYLHHELDKDHANMRNQAVKSLKALVEFDMGSYLNQRDPSLVSLLLGISGKPHVTEVEVCMDDANEVKSTYKLCKTVESIVNLTGLSAVFPVHLRESVLINSVGGSALSLQLLSSTSPHASYRTIRDWLNQLGTDTEMNLSGNLVGVFDNNQTLQRRWRVMLENKVYCNVVTIVAFFQLNRNGDLQTRSDLKPGIWLMKGIGEDVKQKIKFIDKIDEVKQTHYDRHLYPYWSRIIKEVIEDQRMEHHEDSDEPLFVDSIDDCAAVKKKNAMYKKCFDCNTNDIDMNKINCPNCKTNLKQSKQRYLGLSDKSTYSVKEMKKTRQMPKQYRLDISEVSGQSRVKLNKVEVAEEEGIPPNKCHVTEPVFVNPCSYNAVNSVLKHIGEKSGIAKYNNGIGSREWVIVYCDGSPYNLCFRIITCTYRCAICADTLCGMKEVEKHLQSHMIAREDFNGQYSLEYDWVLLQPGPGHIEMNMLKGITDLCWEIFWKDLAQLMNFTSDKALFCCRKVSDHHKGWQLATIAREGLSRELVLPFVRKQLSTGATDISAVQFARFLKDDVQNATFAFVADMVFEFMDAMFMYREGVRTDQADLMFAAMSKFAKLWSGRNHPLYRELEMSFALTLARVPDEVGLLLRDSWSINTSGVPKTNEGPDFKLEAINKTIQHWLPSNPSGLDWQQACCQYDELLNLRKKMFEQIALHDPKIRRKEEQPRLDQEISEFRELIRTKGYLNDPCTSKYLVSLDGRQLNQELTNFSNRSREKRALYFDAYMEHEPRRSEVRTNIPFKEPPICVTMEEKADLEKIDRKTIQTLREEIEFMLASIADDSIKEAFSEILQEVKTKKGAVKADYLAVHMELAEFLENDNDYISIGEEQDD